MNTGKEGIRVVSWRLAGVHSSAQLSSGVWTDPRARLDCPEQVRYWPAGFLISLISLSSFRKNHRGN